MNSELRAGSLLGDEFVSSERRHGWCCDCGHRTVSVVAEGSASVNREPRAKYCCAQRVSREQSCGCCCVYGQQTASRGTNGDEIVSSEPTRMVLRL